MTLDEVSPSEIRGDDHVVSAAEMVPSQREIPSNFPGPSVLPSLGEMLPKDIDIDHEGEHVIVSVTIGRRRFSDTRRPVHDDY
jgi:hypothetical protein